jgi:hypothetical protein
LSPAVFVFWSHDQQEIEMSNELLRSILVLLIGYGLRLLLAAIGVEIDPVLFNTLVAAIVAYILAALGLEVAKSAAPKYFK